VRELQTFKELIKQEKYYEAHEVLEDLWQQIRKTDNPLKWAYKGLINAAVTFELIKRKRNSYNIPWKNYKKYENYYKLNEEIKQTAEFINNYALILNVN
jgi:predicted metal-dependent hydrolase